MSSYVAETFMPHLRLTILQLLVEQDSTSLLDGLLIDGVRAAGFPATSDQVRAALGWLTEQGLVEREQMQRFTSYAATERAADVVARRVRVDGVRRPGW